MDIRAHMRVHSLCCIQTLIRGSDKANCGKNRSVSYCSCLSLLPVKQVQLGLSPSLKSLTPCAPVRPQLRHLNVYIYLTLRKKLKLRMGRSPFLFEGLCTLNLKKHFLWSVIFPTASFPHVPAHSCHSKRLFGI